MSKLHSICPTAPEYVTNHPLELPVAFARYDYGASVMFFKTTLDSSQNLRVYPEPFPIISKYPAACATDKHTSISSASDHGLYPKDSRPSM